MTANRNPAPDLIEDVEWIIGTDSPDSIARRLGYKRVKVLRELLHRNGRPDLATRLWEGRL